MAWAIVTAAGWLVTVAITIPSLIDAMVLSSVAAVGFSGCLTGCLLAIVIGVASAIHESNRSCGPNSRDLARTKPVRVVLRVPKMARVPKPKGPWSSHCGGDVDDWKSEDSTETPDAAAQRADRSVLEPRTNERVHRAVECAGRLGMERWLPRIPSGIYPRWNLAASGAALVVGRGFVGGGLCAEDAGGECRTDGGDQGRRCANSGGDSRR